MLKKFTKTVALAGLSLFLTIGPAHAAFKLKLTDLDTLATTTILGAGGAVAFAGVVGNWTFNTAIGTSKPGFGTATAPNMGLLSANSQNLKPNASLLIELTDTDFDAGLPGSITGLAGVINGSDVHELQYKAWVDDNNAEFGHGGLIGDTGSFFDLNTYSFANSGLLKGTYSLTMEVLVTHDKIGLETKFDAELARVPEPGTLALLGLGLGLLGVSARRRRR